MCRVSGLARRGVRESILGMLKLYDCGYKYQHEMLLTETSEYLQ